MTDPNVPPDSTPPPIDPSPWAPGAQQNPPVPPAPPAQAWPNQPWQPPQVPPPPPAGSWQAPSPYDLGATSGEEMLPAPAPRKSRRRLIAATAAVVVVVGGAAVTYGALNDASSGGASSPQAAVRNAISDLQNSDMIGLLDDLPAGERSALSGPLQDDIASLKRLGVLSANADPHKISGVHFTATNVAFAPDDIAVNDHVHIVRITAGTVTANATAMQLPLTAHMLDVTHASSVPPATEHTDLSQVSGGVRIATVKQSGGWYVSLFYTAADSIADHAVPAPSDYIAPVGAGSGSEAVKDAVTDLLTGKLSGALARLSPDELGAVHDYGGLILKDSQSFPDTGVRLGALEVKETSLDASTVKVTLSKLQLTLPGGQSFSMQADGSCYSTTTGGHTTKVCASDSVGAIESLLGSLSCFGEASSGGSAESIAPDGTAVVIPDSGSNSSLACPGEQLTAAQKTALSHLISGLTQLGVVAGLSGGQWYVEPVRTVTQLTDQALGSLQGNDLFDIISIFTDLQH